MNPVFSFIQHTVGLVVGSQCGFVYFLDGADGAFGFVEGCQRYLFTAGNEFVVFVGQHKQDAVHPVLVFFCRGVACTAVAVGLIVFVVRIDIRCRQLHLHIYVHHVFRLFRLYIRFYACFFVSGVAATCNDENYQYADKKNVPFALCHSIKLLRISAYKNKTNDNVFQFLTIFFLIFMN